MFDRLSDYRKLRENQQNSNFFDKRHDNAGFDLLLIDQKFMSIVEKALKKKSEDIKPLSYLSSHVTRHDMT